MQRKKGATGGVALMADHQGCRRGDGAAAENRRAVALGGDSRRTGASSTQPRDGATRGGAESVETSASE